MNRGCARSSGGYRGSRGRSPASGKRESPVSVGKTLDESSASGGGWSRGRGGNPWPRGNNGSGSAQAYVPKKSSSPVVMVGCVQGGDKQVRESQEDDEADSATSRFSEDSTSETIDSINQRDLCGGSFISGGYRCRDMDDGTSSLPGLAVAIANVSFSSVPSSIGRKDKPSGEVEASSSCVSGGLGHSCNADVMRPFDIFLEKKGSPFMLKPSLLAQNRERRNVIKQSTERCKGIVLRRGMVLLKNYLSIDDQVMILKTCRQLGVGHGGFYQPGYRDGASLHLKMMCLGKNWDPETSQYGVTRPVDGAKSPKIPIQFNQFVEKVVKESQNLVSRSSKKANGEDEIPSLSPDICIVNFYTSTGRLGLHQDKDESEESLLKGLPVVSFSIGDSAEFLYGDQRDVERAEKVILESGDVLLFGGKARKVFHGVKSILPNSSPKALINETNLRPGRLNLTFRQY